MKRAATVFVGVLSLAGVVFAGAAGYRWVVKNGEGGSCAAPPKAAERCPCGLCSDPDCRCAVDEPEPTQPQATKAGVR